MKYAYITNSDKAEALESYLTKWSHLPTASAIVLGFIVARTIRYGKINERIPNRHFAEGVWSGETPVQQPCAIRTNKTITKAIGDLEDRGLISVNPAELGREVTINCQKLVEGDVPMLRIPKQKQPKVDQEQTNNCTEGEEKFLSRGRNNSYEGGRKNSCIKHRDKYKSYQIEGVAGGAGDTPEVEGYDSAREAIQQRIEQVNEKHRKAQERRAATKGHTHVGFTSLWCLNFDKYHPGLQEISPPTARSWGIFRKNLKAFNVPMAEFLDWVFANWRELSTGHLKWLNKLKGMGDVPKFDLLAFYARHFYEAYLEFGYAVESSQRRLTHRDKELSKMRAQMGDMAKELEKAGQERAALRRENLTLKSISKSRTAPQIKELPEDVYAGELADKLPE